MIVAVFFSFFDFFSVEREDVGFCHTALVVEAEYVFYAGVCRLRGIVRKLHRRGEGVRFFVVPGGKLIHAGKRRFFSAGYHVRADAPAVDRNALGDKRRNDVFGEFVRNGNLRVR